MNKKFVHKSKRLLSGIIATTIAVSMLPTISAFAETGGKYPYTFFAGSSADGAISTTAYNFCVNGNVVTNGTISAPGNMNINGTKTENANEDMIYIFDKIDSKYFSSDNVDEHIEDYTLQETNININTPTEVMGETTLTGNININTALKAFEDITLNGEVKNTNDSVIYSKYGDIVIDSTNVNLNGLIYAPFGSVEIKTTNLNLNNVVIIADSIAFDCPNLNANFSNSVADFVGNISEPLNIPKDEWQYMKDENENDLPDFFENFNNWEKLVDTDGDSLPDSIEEYLGSDSNNIDTDGDHLNDYYEVFVTYTDPTKSDTDENGVNDGDEDYDEDKLSNLEEFANKTNPYIDDMDDDGLTDGDEIKKYNTDPLVADTDGDELDDNDELILGTNPLVTDTDGDGIIDSKEKIQQNFTHKVKNEDCAVTEVMVDMECTGNINNTTTIKSVMNVDILCTDVVGLVGEPFEIETVSEFDKATITFKIDKEKLDGVSFDNLLFLWYNEEENEFVELETTLNEENSTASVVTTHFSKYMVVDKYQWFRAWSEEFDYNPTGDGTGAPTIPVKYNTVLAIDCSGSMSGNDPISTKSSINSAYDAQHRYICNRITAAEEFIKYMKLDDETAIVLFTDSAYTVAPITSDKETLKLALQKMYSYGNTSFSAALNASITQINSAKKILNGVNKNRIILLSDGDDLDDENRRDVAINACKEKHIEVYTVGFGAPNDSILEEIAQVTGGKYYKAMSAEDIIGEFAKYGYEKDFDMTDTDGDGLPDSVETAGIRLKNGRIIFTNPDNPDTDEDGLLDGEEINSKPLYSEKEDNGWLGIKKLFDTNTIKGYYFAHTSDPTNVDSDEDGYADGPTDILNTGKYDDPRCLKCDVFVYKLSDSENYVPIYDDKGAKFYGGDQSWIEESDYENRNIYSEGGCAIAATCDLLLYLKRIDKNFSCEINFEDFGITDFDYITKQQYVDLYYHIASNYMKPVDFSEYKAYIESSLFTSAKGMNITSFPSEIKNTNYIKYLVASGKKEVLELITGGTYTWGIMPWDYPQNVSDACGFKNVQNIDLLELSLRTDILSKAQWFDDNPLDKAYIKSLIQQQFIEQIKKSLSNNCMVTLCYGVASAYTLYENTELTSYRGEKIRNAAHYVNITEYTRDEIANHEYITIASWGNRLYIEPEQIFNGHGIGGALFFYEK